jgi:hypothetical protein
MVGIRRSGGIAALVVAAGLREIYAEQVQAGRVRVG